MLIRIHNVYLNSESESSRRLPALYAAICPFDMPFSVGSFWLMPIPTLPFPFCLEPRLAAPFTFLQAILKGM